MESDDDTFIVIVGDAVDKSLIAFIERIEAFTKDDACQDIEPVYLDSNFEVSIKDELEDEENVSVKEELSIHKNSDQDYTPDDEVFSNYLDDTVTKKKTVKPHRRHSYVQTMKSIYPELQDKKLLIKTLVAIMKDTKPPPPPINYVMEGIMPQCTICDHRSVSIPAAGRHYQEKHGERYLYCLACGVNFRSKTNLYKHEKHCNAPDAVTVLKARAEYLGAKGRSRPFLPKDSKKGKPKPKYDCTQCSASFLTKESMTAHTHMHAGTRPYVCGICFRAYTYNTTLLRHLKTHDENERYECDHCQMCFKVKRGLVAHMDTHKTLKRFACNECERRFTQRANLLLHVHRQHRGLPPPCACRLCPKRYPRMSVLKEHMMKVHGMQLMTQKMFFKALPTLSDGQVDKAKIVMKSELLEDPVYFSMVNDDLT